jgi:hypothetical protein
MCVLWLLQKLLKRTCPEPKSSKKLCEFLKSRDTAFLSTACWTEFSCAFTSIQKTAQGLQFSPRIQTGVRPKQYMCDASCNKGKCRMLWGATGWLGLGSPGKGHREYGIWARICSINGTLCGNSVLFGTAGKSMTEWGKSGTYEYLETDFLPQVSRGKLRRWVKELARHADDFLSVLAKVGGSGTFSHYWQSIWALTCMEDKLEKSITSKSTHPLWPSNYTCRNKPYKYVVNLHMYRATNHNITDKSSIPWTGIG